MTFILLSLTGLLKVTVYFDRDWEETLRRLLKYFKFKKGGVVEGEISLIRVISVIRS